MCKKKDSASRASETSRGGRAIDCSEGGEEEAGNLLQRRRGELHSLQQKKIVERDAWRANMDATCGEGQMESHKKKKNHLVV